jgi:hypothetical protein
VAVRDDPPAARPDHADDDADAVVLPGEHVHAVREDRPDIGIRWENARSGAVQRPGPREPRRWACEDREDARDHPPSIHPHG